MRLPDFALSDVGDISEIDRDESRTDPVRPSKDCERTRSFPVQAIVFSNWSEGWRVPETPPRLPSASRVANTPYQIQHAGVLFWDDNGQRPVYPRKGAS
jgi:hypothetical protein